MIFRIVCQFWISRKEKHCIYIACVFLECGADKCDGRCEVIDDLYFIHRCTERSAHLFLGWQPVSLCLQSWSSDLLASPPVASSALWGDSNDDSENWERQKNPSTLWPLTGDPVWVIGGGDQFPQSPQLIMQAYYVQNWPREQRQHHCST